MTSTESDTPQAEDIGRRIDAVLDIRRLLARVERVNLDGATPPGFLRRNGALAAHGVTLPAAMWGDSGDRETQHGYIPGQPLELGDFLHYTGSFE